MKRYVFGAFVVAAVVGTTRHTMAQVPDPAAAQAAIGQLDFMLGRGGGRLDNSGAASAYSLLSGSIVRAQAPTPVFVLATLYNRHASVPAYSHDSLAQIIRRINPEVLVLDVSPRELKAREVALSKAEYPQVIFPFMEAHALPTYPAEPDEPEFTRVVSQLGADLKRFQTEQPAVAAADRAHNEATYQALAHLWRSPAAVNGPVTDLLLSARRRYQDQMAGSGVAEAWRWWNQHALAMVQRAVAEHPGRRVLVLIGVENCGPLRAALAKEPNVQLVDMASWLSTG